MKNHYEHIEKGVKFCIRRRSICFDQSHVMNPAQKLSSHSYTSQIQIVRLICSMDSEANETQGIN